MGSAAAMPVSADARGLNGMSLEEKVAGDGPCGSCDSREGFCF